MMKTMRQPSRNLDMGRLLEIQEDTARTTPAQIPQALKYLEVEDESLWDLESATPARRVGESKRSS